MIARKWRQERRHTLWRHHSDAVNLKLVQNWWPDEPVEYVLKTDLFDEALGEGMYPYMYSNAKFVTGIDLSDTVVAAVQEKRLNMQTAVADVRRLPFRSNKVDLIISNSTLDHFKSLSDISIALDELYRVLRPGGRMLLTLDNLRNPIIALRQVLPSGLTSTLDLVPYYVGPTYGPRGLSRAVLNARFRITDTASLMHCPRLIAVAAAGFLQRHAKSSAQHRFLRGLMAFEKLSHLPTHSLTGHYVAVNAVK